MFEIGGWSNGVITSSVEVFSLAGIRPPPPPPPSPPPTGPLQPKDLIPFVQKAKELPGKSQNGLIAKLWAAQAKYDLKDFATSINIMNAFYHQVKAFANGGHMFKVHIDELYQGYVSVVKNMSGTPLPAISTGFFHDAWVIGDSLGLKGSTTILAALHIPVR